MVTGPAIKAFLEYLNPRLRVFGVLEQNVYCPELDFRKAALEHMVLFENVSKNHVVPLVDKLGYRKSKWAVMAWSRQSLQDQAILGLRTPKANFQRISQIGKEAKIDVVKTKPVDCPLDLAIFTNSIATGETLEEYLKLFLHEQIFLNFPFPILDEMLPLTVSRADDVRFEKLPSSEFGALSIVGVSIKLTFPIFLDIGTYPVILDILNSVYLNFYNDLYAVFETKAESDGTTSFTIKDAV